MWWKRIFKNVWKIYEFWNFLDELSWINTKNCLNVVFSAELINSSSINSTPERFRVKLKASENIDLTKKTALVFFETIIRIIRRSWVEWSKLNYWRRRKTFRRRISRKKLKLRNWLIIIKWAKLFINSSIDFYLFLFLESFFFPQRNHLIGQNKVFVKKRLLNYF